MVYLIICKYSKINKKLKWNYKSKYIFKKHIDLDLENLDVEYRSYIFFFG